MSAVKEIKMIYKGNQEITAMVDEDCYDLVKDYTWTWRPTRGVAANVKGKVILMHNLIVSYSRVTFIDGNKLNCRRENLTTFKGNSHLTRTWNGKNYSHNPKRKFYVVARYATINDRKEAYRKFFSYKDEENNQEQAEKDAIAHAAEVKAWPREKVVSMIMNRIAQRKKAKINKSLKK